MEQRNAQQPSGEPDVAGASGAGATASHAPGQVKSVQLSATGFFLRWFGVPILLIITLIVVHQSCMGGK